MGRGSASGTRSMDSVPTEVHKYWNSVLLGTGRTFVTERWDGWPPKVAAKLLTNASMSLGETYTWVESYCAPTATPASPAGTVWPQAGEVAARSNKKVARTVAQASRIVGAFLQLGICKSTFPCYGRLPQLIVMTEWSGLHGKGGRPGRPTVTPKLWLPHLSGTRVIPR
jgi:hypothetical protein